MASLVRLLLLIIPLGLNLAASSITTANDQFIYSGFGGSNLIVDDTATVTPDGLVELTNGTAYLKGHAFHPAPFRLHDSVSGNGTVRSFSVAFVFGIVSVYPDFSAHGMAFVMAPRTNFSDALPAKYLGLTNVQNDGNSSNHIFAVELDTIQSVEFKDMNANHVGIDINGLQSLRAYNAGYYYDDKSGGGGFQSLKLISREAMQVWVDYHREKKEINVTLAPLGVAKPGRPLLSATYDLSAVLADLVYLGFSAATGRVNSRHCVLGWSFGVDKQAPAIDITKLPKLPRAGPKPRSSKVLIIVLPIATATFVLGLGGALVLVVRKRSRYAELREDWEVEFGPHRFSYKDLFRATDGFRDKHLLGAGGFGRVYRGVLETSKLEVAVKKVSHESRQGMKEFISEITSIGRIRHRNLVQLLGYCRRKGELLLVYAYMPNGSLDKHLYDNGEDGRRPTLSWAQRFQIIRDVAAGLVYLHERWEKVVIHRDIKASNVLLDKGMNGQLGDFGLARLYDHGTDSQTTHVVGTMGYLAPELVRTGRASPPTDVFAFGIFLLEVACGQRPIKEKAQGEQIALVDWVLEHWLNGTIMETVDARLRGEYDVDKVELVLALGLMCSHPLANARPSIGQVMRYLTGVTPLPELTPTDVLALMQNKGLAASDLSYPDLVSSFGGTISSLSGGR